jgi:chemotaxis protein MotB
MPRRHRPPESEHTSRWMVSYADFMTLLFAFFVVLYASSVIHKESFSDISEMLNKTFSNTVEFSIPEPVHEFLAENIQPFRSSVQFEKADTETLDFEHLSYDIYQVLVQGLEINAMSRLVNITEEDEFVQIEVDSQSLFFPDSFSLTAQGEQLLNALAKEFYKFPHAISIEVFSAAQLNESEKNPWLLGGNQGAVLLQWLQLESISSTRLSAINYGAYLPNAKSKRQRINFLIHFGNDK